MDKSLQKWMIFLAGALTTVVSLPNPAAISQSNVRVLPDGGAREPAVGEARAKPEPPHTTGSGFLISGSGYILTNNHVVEGCRTLRSSPGNKVARVLASDPGKDLAVVQVQGRFQNVAMFRDGRGIRAGEDIVIFGYPLLGILSSDGNVVPGTVSALVGISDDPSQIQITAPIQPGNSGGPVLDHSGNVVGIVVGKLDAVKFAEVIQDIPQNVNFAISEQVARAFLDSNGIKYAIARSTGKRETPDIAELAKRFTVVLECWQRA